jgi:hypothetical protein
MIEVNIKHNAAYFKIDELFRWQVQHKSDIGRATTRNGINWSHNPLNVESFTFRTSLGAGHSK